MIRSHTVYYSPGKKYSVLDIEEHILGRHKKNFKIIFEDFINSSRFYKIDISVKPKLSLEEHIANRNKWKNRFITYVKHKKHRKKFGILLKALKKHNWSYELWYPGNQKPCRSFMKHQWELEKQNYDNITVNDNIWVENVSNQIIKQEQFAEQFNLTLTFCVNNVIDNWEWSTGKIIRIKNTKICPDFIGLLVKIKQRFL